MHAPHTVSEQVTYFANVAKHVTAAVAAHMTENKWTQWPAAVAMGDFNFIEDVDLDSTRPETAATPSELIQAYHDMLGALMPNAYF